MVHLLPSPHEVPQKKKKREKSATQRGSVRSDGGGTGLFCFRVIMQINGDIRAKGVAAVLHHK